MSRIVKQSLTVSRTWRVALTTLPPISNNKVKLIHTKRRRDVSGEVGRFESFHFQMRTKLWTRTDGKPLITSVENGTKPTGARILTAAPRCVKRGSQEYSILLVGLEVSRKDVSGEWVRIPLLLYCTHKESEK